MKLSTRILSGLAAAILATACSSSDSGGSTPATQSTQPGQVNTPVAKQAAAQTITAVTSLQSSNDGKSGVSSLEGAAAQAQGIISPATGSGGLPAALLGATIGTARQALGTDAGCVCDETAKTCTYTNCSPNGATNFTVNGKMSWGNGKVVATNLVYDVSQTGGIDSIHITLDCDLTVSATSIDGTMHTTGNTAFETGDAGSSGIGQVTYAWDTSIKYDAVTYANGAATGGSLDVTGSYTISYGASGILPDQTYSGTASVTFP